MRTWRPKADRAVGRRRRCLQLLGAAPADRPSVLGEQDRARRGK
jgi:hypothetical protein